MSDNNQGSAPEQGSLVQRLVRNGAWLDEQEFPPIKWKVDGLIPEGAGLLTGPPKGGKSWFVGAIGLAAAGAGKALGNIDIPQCPVLYLATEDTPARLQDRARKLLDDEPIPEAFDFVTDINNVPVVQLIEEWMVQHKGRDPLVILDTLGKVMPPAMPGESAYSRDYRIGATLKRLTDNDPGSSLIIVHHVRKAEAGGDWMDSTNGTNGLNGAMDYTINLSRDRNQGDGVLRVTGRTVEENEFAVQFNNGKWTVKGDDLKEAAERAAETRATLGVGADMRRVIAYVNGEVEAVSPSQVADALDVKIDNVRRYLSRAAEQGRLTKPSRGLYAGVQSVRSGENDTSTSENKPDTANGSSVQSVRSGEDAEPEQDTPDTLPLEVDTPENALTCEQDTPDTPDTHPVASLSGLPVSTTAEHGKVLNFLQTEHPFSESIIADSLGNRIDVTRILADLVADNFAAVDDEGRYIKTERGLVA